MFDELTDADIEAAIDQHDDTDHPDAHTVDEVRDVLGQINRDLLDNWDLFQDAIDDGAQEIAFEDRSVVVLEDVSGQFWNEQFDVMDVDDEHGILQGIVKQLHHSASVAHVDRRWPASYPVVVEKSDEFEAGEQQVLREIARRTEELGSVARAVDTLATDVHGWSKGNWATLTGRNRSTVTRTTDN